jgi:hypothetical protein
MKIEIKSWISGSVLFEGDFSCLAEAVSAAVKKFTNLSRANLSGADLSCANLSGADLSCANLSRANLSGADLSRANLSGADLSRANLSGANLSGADLSCANLYGADLSCANLSGANLYGANLYGANLYAYASVCFKGHGECGRQLTALIQKEGDPIKLWCGCFCGSVDELRKYIANGDPLLAKTRTLALDTVLVLLAAQNEKGTT